MYTSIGTIIAASYSGECTECKAVINHSSWTIQNGNDKQQLFFDPSHSQYIQCTPLSVFETKLLDHLTHQIVHAGVTFESQPLVYNEVHGTSDEKRLSPYIQCFRRTENMHGPSWKLNETRLGDGWFVYQLVRYYSESGNLPNQEFYTEPTKGNRRDLEDLCEHENLIRSSASPKWVHHQCSTKGCSEGFAVIDGNEKINRTICAAPKTRVSIPREYIYMTSMCTRSPTIGGNTQGPQNSVSITVKN